MLNSKFLTKSGSISSGDMGFSAEKTYDIEAWIPSEKSIEKYQVVRLAVFFKQEEWVPNINLKTEMNLLERLMVRFSCRKINDSFIRKQSK